MKHDDPPRCSETVHEGRGMHHQCFNPAVIRGKCRVHSDDAKRRRDKKRDDAFAAKRMANARVWSNQDLGTKVRQICFLVDAGDVSAKDAYAEIRKAMLEIDKRYGLES